MLRTRTISGIAMIAVMAGLASLVHAAAISDTEPVGQAIYNTTQNLSVANPSFYTDWATYPGYKDELWALTGLSNVAGEGLVRYYGQANLNFGDAWQFGSLIYKFHTDDMFNGGTVDNRLYWAPHAGNGTHLLATTAVAPTTTNGWDVYDIVAFDQVMYTTLPGNQENTYTVNIPTGVQDFWVIVGKRDGTYSDASYQRSLDVQANVIPEPASMALMGLGALMMIRRRR